MPADEAKFQALIHFVCDEYGDYLNCADPGEAFRRLAQFRLLCVHAKGWYGARRLNTCIEECMVQKGLIAVESAWYAGRPILVSQNDYNLGLFNGDSGIALRDAGGELRVFFPGPQGKMRSYSPLRIPPHETAFAVTVHKSQGSEFDHVALLLPEAASPVLCRELLYTAVTRARKKFTLWGDPRVLEEGVKKKVQRSSGLAEKLEAGNLKLEI
jgi:exodeoxyribonuclease V alpha subunit